MSQPDFSAYLDSVCGKIKNKVKREEIRQELLCHLEDNYERNMATGMTPEQATANAVEKMGDSDVLSYRFEQLYSFSPVKAMSSAFVGLIFAYITFNFIITGTVKEILFVCSLPLFFSVLLRMRKMNKTMEKAFHFFNLHCIFYFFSYFLNMGREIPTLLSFSVMISIFLLRCVFLFFVFTGLNGFCKEYITPESKKPHLIACAVYHIIQTAFACVILILTDGKNTTINSFVLPIIFLFFFFFCIAQLMRVRRLLWDADGEYNILPDDKKHFITVSSVFASAVCIVLAFNYFSSVMSPKKMEFVMHDTESEKISAADETRKKMLSWEVPESVVNDLPDSEILNYEKAEFLLFDASGKSLGNEAETDVYNYWFFIPEEGHSEHYSVRLLCYIENHFTEKARLYRAGYYFSIWDNLMPLNMSNTESDYFVSIITDEGDKKYNASPFILHNFDSENVLDYPKGFEYREEKGQRIYMAMNMGINNMEQQVSGNFAVIRKDTFLSFGYNSTAVFADSMLHYGYVSIKDYTYPFEACVHGTVVEPYEYLQNER